MSTSVSGSSAINGLRSNPNVISGLVSGLDTESMIEGLVDSYSQKITGFQQQIVLQEWKQEAYRGVIDSLQNFMGKFTNFSSSSTTTNLLSNSLFANCTTSSAKGENSDSVKVTGTTDSNVSIDSVLQVATSTSIISSALADKTNKTTIEGENVSLSDPHYEGTLSGTMSLKYGSSEVNITFNSEDIINNADDLVKSINEKLQDLTISGDPANTRIEASLDDSGNVVFKDLKEAGNDVYISYATEGVTKEFGITPSTSYSEEATKIDLSGTTFDFVDESTVGDTLVGKQITVQFNGTSKSFTIEEFDSADKMVETLNTQLQEAFGGSLKVENLGSDGALELKFSTALSGSNSFTVSSSVGEALGLGGTSMSNTLTGKSTLSSVSDEFDGLGRTYAIGDDTEVDLADIGLQKNEALFVATGGATWNEAAGCYYDTEGDKVVAVDGAFYKTDNEGNLRIGESLEINGVSVGAFDGESTIDDVLNAINSSECGVKASFSTLTNNFVLSSSTEGAQSGISIEAGGLAEKIFGATNGTDNTDKITYTAGQDAIVLATVNGEQVELVRSSNTIALEGLNITVSSTFNNTTVDGAAITSAEEYNAAKNSLDPGAKLNDTGSVTFTEETDYDPIVDAVSQMLDEYNELMSELKSLFTEVPLSNTSGSSYLPLTDDDMESMSDAAIAKYEANAKTGLLFGDSNMRGLYNSLSSVFSSSGAFGMDLYEMGVECQYGTSNGDHVTLDKDKLIAMLQSDPTRVQNAFASSTNSGGSVDGVMQTLKNKMEEYGSTTGTNKGVLVEAAGTERSPSSLLDNSMLTKIESFQKLIETWESKLESQITYYTSQFSKLEVLMSQANSQSAALGSVSGY